MSSFPAASYLSDAARTEGEMKTALENLLKATKQIPGAGIAEGALTIAAGSVTPTAGVGIFSIDTEGAAATDDLTNIVQTEHDAGSIIIIRITAAARVVVVKNAAGGAGQISLRSGGDFVLGDTSHRLVLHRVGTTWEELFRIPENGPLVLTKTANYTVTVADRGKLIDGTSGTWTLTLLAAATAGKGFVLPVKNSGSGYITIDGNAAETIDGATTMILQPNDEIMLVCDGSNWKSYGRYRHPVSPTHSFRGLHLRTHPDSDAAASKVWFKADEIVWDDGERTADVGPVVVDMGAANGAGGRDAGTEQASTWYSVYAIRKRSDGTVSGLFHREKDWTLDQSHTVSNSDQQVRDDAARTKVAQSFLVGTAGVLPFIDVDLFRNSSPTGNVWFTIEADSAGSPSGTPLATSDKIDVSKLYPAGNWIRFVFRTPATLTGATTYWIVFNGDYAISAANNVVWRAHTAIDYASGVAKQYSGAAWSNLAGGGDFKFKTYVERNNAAVTMPSGYDQKCLLGYVYNNSSSNFKKFHAVNRSVKYILESESTPGQAATSSTNTLMDCSAILPPVPVRAFAHGLSNATANIDTVINGVMEGWRAVSGGDTDVRGTLVTASNRGYLGALHTEFQAIYSYAGSGAVDVYLQEFEW